MTLPPRTLGAVLAGGASRRFGSDKAHASLGGTPMLDHIVTALAPQVTDLVICGRSWSNLRTLSDATPERIGPLAGLESALRFAAANGFDAVLTAPVDVVPLPHNLTARLAGPRAAVFEQQWLIGYWPSSLHAALAAFLATGDHRWRAWIELCGAIPVAEPHPLHNINTRADWTAARAA
ncbi:molybdenum cofactor guanylyltransferase [Sphingomonas sp. BT-65]|uniref:molybdenum cofactor guanylyltransferase n=1 Tax=Sphingomonas sp. BT-65 TaxID=2989821 RepID=UPI002235A204|nr:molybdenum cofactor guanylyltransferase [Sphingomonas sp. BT-65]MCW4461486.1 molybdenum cofactor guanylyltransferase [Sphingomonas sp. BT-65]